MNLVTEDYLRTLFKKEIPEEFKVNRKTIITPSAREYLQEKKVDLIIDDSNSTRTGAKHLIKHLIPIEASERHAHLTEEDMTKLFGEDYQMTINKELSQAGQYQYKEKVKLIGPMNMFRNVLVTGPAKDRSQVKLSRSDALTLGLNPPIREFGDLDGAASIYLGGTEDIIKIEEGLIIVKAHIHMTLEDAKKMNLKDRDLVKIRVKSSRPITFEDVLVRVNEKCTLSSMYIDFDEANACGFEPGIMGELVELRRE